MKRIELLIAEAEGLLSDHPFDELHDLDHHKHVWEKAQLIAKQIDGEVNKEALQVAVMWHDVMVGDETQLDEKHKNIDMILTYLVELMEKQGFDGAFQKVVTDAIRYHEFGTKKQVNTEGEILFDADKLDVLNPRRYRKLIRAVKNKKLSKFQIFVYVKTAKIWLSTMRRRYHFEISRKLHDEMVAKLLEDKEAVELGKKWGLDLAEVVK